MEHEDVALTLKLARGVFFRAMLAGYAGNSNNDKVTKIKSLNGNEVTIAYTEGDFVVVDCYNTTPGFNTSVGKTLILFRGNPIWWMSYEGEYTDSVIPFLKSALAGAYSIGLFNGGRGPADFNDGRYRYRNRCSPKSRFDAFFGREEILVSKSNGLLGYHEYRGQSMIGHPPII